MKEPDKHIVLLRRLPAAGDSHDNTAKYVKTVFDKVANKMLVAGISVQDVGEVGRVAHTVVIKYVLNGAPEESDDFVQIVKGIVAKKTDLEYIQMDTPFPYRRLDGIRSGAQKGVYVVDKMLVVIATRTPGYSDTLLARNLKRVILAYQVVGSKLSYSGMSVLETYPDARDIKFDESCLYQCFGYALMFEEIRLAMQARGEQVEMVFQKPGEMLIVLNQKEVFRIPLVVPAAKEDKQKHSHKCVVTFSLTFDDKIRLDFHKAQAIGVTFSNGVVVFVKSPCLGHTEEYEKHLFWRYSTGLKFSFEFLTSTINKETLKQFLVSIQTKIAGCNFVNEAFDVKVVPLEKEEDLYVSKKVMEVYQHWDHLGQKNRISVFQTNADGLVPKQEGERYWRNEIGQIGAIYYEYANPSVQVFKSSPPAADESLLETVSSDYFKGLSPKVWRKKEGESADKKLFVMFKKKDEVVAKKLEATLGSRGFGVSSAVDAEGDTELTVVFKK